MASVGPFAKSGRWYRGNLHGHTTESDGALSPAEYVAAYRAKGHDFTAVTDHGKVTDISGLASHEFTVIAGAELDGPGPRPKGHHVVALGIRALPARPAGADLGDTLASIRTQGGIAFVAHPYETGLTAADLAAVSGCAGIEVWNTCSAFNWGKGDASMLWDELLAGGADLAAIATDDCHRKPQQADDLGFGWVVVRAARLSAGEVLAALAGGDFYASTGPDIEDVDLRRTPGGLRARVRCTPCRRVHFLCDRGLGRSAHAASDLMSEAEHTVSAEASYLRVVCEDAAGRWAWSNPFRLPRDVPAGA